MRRIDLYFVYHQNFVCDWLVSLLVSWGLVLPRGVETSFADVANIVGNVERTQRPEKLSVIYKIDVVR